MEVTLPPDVQTDVEGLVASGEFLDSVSVVVKAMRLWKSERERVLAMVQEGIDSADRGELRDGPECMAELLAQYSEGAKVPEAA